MKIGLRITTYNRKRFSEQCLKSLIWSRPKNTIVCVVDNASTDGTRESIQNFLYEKSPINSILLNSRNEHLGYSILQAWSMLASLGCDILGGANNDFLFEPGWEENLISCFQETDVDYILSCFHKHRSKKLKKCTTKSGKGVYIEDRNPMGAGYFIRSKHFTDRGLKHSTKPFSYKNIGPGPHWQREVKRRKLKGIRLLSPAVLVRKPEYSNPEYVKYYDEVFGIRGMENTLKTYRKMERDGTPRGTLNWNEFIDKYYSDKINEKEK